MKSKQTYSIKYALLLNVHRCHKMKQGTWSWRVLVLGLTGRVLFIQATPGRDVNKYSFFILIMYLINPDQPLVPLQHDHVPYNMAKIIMFRSTL